MTLHVVGGNATAGLAGATAALLGLEPIRARRQRFPDGELDIRVDANLRNGDVYIVQSTGPPVDQNLVELLLLVDACRRLGATRVTAVAPYFGYARHDRRTAPGQPLGARVVCDTLAAVGVDAVVTVDPHTVAVESMLRPLHERLSAVRILCEALPLVDRDETVVVAPDLGAAKLADHYAARLGVGTAIVRKERLSATEVRTRSIAGDVAGKRPIIVDDMISTGATIVAATHALLDAGATPRVLVVASHGLFIPPARERFADLPLDGIVTTDSVAVDFDPPVLCTQVSLAPLLADTIRRLHLGEPLAEVATYE
jgi:ribose-phosphate pyrophosphokinase